ncbi:hypothetical protein C8R48DRAFT_590638, partial [Suillus tomentosus]
AALKVAQHTKACKFKDALDDAWDHINETTKMIVGSHQKSIRRIQNQLYFGHGALRSKCSKPNLWNAFCWKKNQDKENYGQGRSALQSLVQDNKEAYRALSKQEQGDLLKEFAEHRDTKTTGMRISTKSKVNDITHTLKAVEKRGLELNSLKCCTGAECILFAMYGLTDLPLRGVTFTTEGVENFMDSAMGIDNQDFMSKMEGFAIQGIKGAGKNHQQLISDTRASIRKLINVKLRQFITGEPHATMQWTHYFRNVVQRYQVVIEGWPDNIKFTNLSNVSSALPELQMLERRWQSGATKWITIDDDELERLRLERDEQLERGEVVDHRRHTRSDKGRKRRQPAASQKVTTDWQRKHKSAEFIESSDEEDEPDQPPTSSASPVAQSTVVGSVDESGPSTNDPPQSNFNTESTPSINEPTRFNTTESGPSTNGTLQFNTNEFTAGFDLAHFDLPGPLDPNATLAGMNMLFGPDDFLNFNGTI